jgi:hypothetical protein
METNTATHHIRTLGTTSSSQGLYSSSTRWSFADTWSNIHPFLNFDYLVSNFAHLTHPYDAVWGAEQDHVAAYRLQKPNMFLAYYIPANRDFGTFWDTTAIHDASYWKSVHPDWVLYKCDRVTPAYQFGNPNVPLDFTNPAMISWQVQTYALPASQNGYDALAPDNIDFGNWYHVCGVYRNGQWVQLFSGNSIDPLWRSAMLNWLKQMRLALQNLPHPLALVPNLAFGGLSPTDPIIQQAVSLSDGVLDEGGFTFYGDRYVSDKSWVQHVQFNELVQKQNKPCYIVNDFPTINRFNIQWALASYLMGKEHLSEISIIPNQHYGVDSWINEYNAQIGRTTNSMYQAQKVYWRNYTNGVSIVNPSGTSSYTVTLNAGTSYVDLYGNHIGPTVTMPPHSGLVLLVESQNRIHRVMHA